MNLHDYIWQRDQGICVYCKDAIGEQLEHVLPRKHDGPNIKENIVLSCTACNMQKFDKLDINLITIAFKHLLDVGESLDWVDKIIDHKKWLINQHQALLNTVVTVKETYKQKIVVSKKLRTSSKEQKLINDEARLVTRQKDLRCLIARTGKKRLTQTQRTIKKQQLRVLNYRLKAATLKIAIFQQQALP